MVTSRSARTRSVPFGLSRRTLLVGGATLLAGACGGSSEGPATASGQPGTGEPAASGTVDAAGLQVVQFFKSGAVPAAVPHRLAFGLGDGNGVLQAGGPSTLEVKVLDAAGASVLPETSVRRHANQLARPYWPVTVNLPAGTYQAVLSEAGRPVGSPAFFEVSASTAIPKYGDRMPLVASPTPSNTQGVTPLCTREPACPLHDVSLDTVVGRKPVALLVGTPAYCQTAVCGPTLDVLLNSRRDGVAFIHAEVWKDNTFAEAAPLLSALNIDFEPILFAIRADGTVADRLDVIFDADDVTAALDKLR